MLFIDICGSISFYLVLFSFSLLSLDRLVLWGWGLWTDRVQITLPVLHRIIIIIT